MHLYVEPDIQDVQESGFCNTAAKMQVLKHCILKHYITKKHYILNDSNIGASIHSEATLLDLEASEQLPTEREPRLVLAISPSWPRRMRHTKTACQRP